VSVCAKREPLTLSHPAREVGVLKRHGVGEGESEVGTVQNAGSLDPPGSDFAKTLV
jgi:hypothetical protein